ncbi:MAG: magnesium transporter [Deltaproteobacteria bacterium]|nr:magnesium transporter [Deltaproteobacteria bacterium]MBZ0219695.1 magnesium transporter [Deltaproteobacteria bacterium]
MRRRLPVHDEVRRTLIQGETGPILALAGELHTADLAHYLSELLPEKAAHALMALPERKQAEVLSYFPFHYQLALVKELGPGRLGPIMNLMSHDDRADLLKALPEDLRYDVLHSMAKAEREDIILLGSYPEGSAGSIMTSDYAVLYPELTAGDSVEALRREAPEKETIDRAFVIDPDRRLLGTVRLQALVFAKPGTLVREIMEGLTHAVRAQDTAEHAARQIARYDIPALPVVDDENRLVGIITHDDAMDVLQAEATEDFHKAGTIGKLPGNVRTASAWLLYRKRVVWLVLLVFGNIFSGAGIAYFEDTIAAFVTLVFFLPLLIDSGGNAGSQAATLMIRALATGDVEIKDWGRMLGREIFIALALGLTMAAAVSLIGIVRGGPGIALVVSLSMLAVVIVGSLFGLSLPFILSRLKMDPAAASAPLITSVADALGIVIYFLIANALLMRGV